MILAGDVGGSKVNLALFHENGVTPRLAVNAVMSAGIIPVRSLCSKVS